MANVSTSTQLRTAIQNASLSDPIINVATGNYSTVTTLAKICSHSEPPVPFKGYSIIGTIPRTSTIINDTRIYQQNIDGAYAPAVVKDLTLQYNSATTNNTAILRATTGTYTLDDIIMTGQHGGWAGNGGVYMSMTASNADIATVNANLTLKNSTVSVTGQASGQNAAFLQSWNNNGNVELSNNIFDEAGLNAGSFHFATMYTGGVTTNGPLGIYKVADNNFSGSGLNKSRGNRLETVEAMVYGNTFNSGAYLDLVGDVTAITIDNNSGLDNGNTFNTIYGGCGIKFNRTSSSGATLVTIDIDSGDTVMISNNQFTGYGLAMVNNNTTTTSLVNVTGTNVVHAGAFAGQTFDRFISGGTLANSITPSGSNRDWINAGAGNDTINSGLGNDYIIGGSGSDSITSGLGNDTILWYETNEGSDTITDFTTAGDILAFRGNSSGGTTFFNFAPGASLTDGTNFITSGSAATNAVPTFIYFGGVLSYDADGSGGGAAVNIATFTGSPTIAASDIKFF